MKILFGVALGTGLGGLARVIVTGWTPSPWDGTFPLGSLLVNTPGSAAIGFLAADNTPGSRFAAPPVLRQWLMAGLCGGFTTFSLFSLEAAWLFLEGRPGAALLHSVLTVG